MPDFVHGRGGEAGAALSARNQDRAPGPIPRSFYRDPPDLVARNLLGKLLVRQESGIGETGRSGSRLSGRIVEVEAYFGDTDPAAHAYAGKTERNAVLFGPPGRAYVYFIYGMHYCLNVSCEPEGRAGCVLIRALEPLTGLARMADLRRRASRLRANAAPRIEVCAAQLTSGPGRLCQAFGITRERDNGDDLTSTQSDLQIQDDGFRSVEVMVTARVGIRKAADRPARFVLAGSAFATQRREAI